MHAKSTERSTGAQLEEMTVFQELETFTYFTSRKIYPSEGSSCVGARLCRRYDINSMGPVRLAVYSTKVGFMSSIWKSLFSDQVGLLCYVSLRISNRLKSETRCCGKINQNYIFLQTSENEVYEVMKIK